MMSGLGGAAMRSEERGLHLIHLLLACATHVASRSIENADICLEYISHLSSPDGDTMQRIAAYFTQALADRMLKAWPGMYKALNSTTPPPPLSDQLLVQRFFFDFCPFLKLSYVITNLAILEAMEGEKVVHIIDLHSFEPTQWLSLLQAFKARPEGPPHLRITCIHHHKDVLDQMARRLNEEAEKLDIPFQFNPIVCRLENLDTECLRVKTGEAVAVTSVLQLHSLLAVDDEACGTSLDSASSTPMSSSPKIMSFLNAIWCLSPKLMVVTEQESNHNGGLMDRIMEALNFYAALFDCMESTMPRTSMERLKIERMLFGVEIKNIIACEGLERKERHEKLEKWIPRLELAGFRQFPLSYHVMMQARRLVQSCHYDAYKIKGENGYFIICWQDQPLFSVSAWRFRRIYKV